MTYAHGPDASHLYSLSTSEARSDPFHMYADCGLTGLLFVSRTMHSGGRIPKYRTKRPNINVYIVLRSAQQAERYSYRQFTEMSWHVSQ